MPQEHGPLDAVEQTAVLESKIVMELAHLRQSRVSLEESLKRNANDIALREGKQQVMMAQILAKRGVKVPPGVKVQVKGNLDGTISLVLP